MKRILTILVVAVSVLITGCASNMTSRDYSVASARQKMKVEAGVVESIREVRIEGKSSGAVGSVGAIAGAALGAIAGGGRGGGLGSYALGIVGSVVGGVIGQITEKKATESSGIEITVKLNGETGDLVAITQEADQAEPFSKGDKVRVLTAATGISRVAHN
ncbi:hypothetical protein [Ralstonia pseudosolanacearum]|uniref:outer membrane lipoprotein n=1 Tax=Ralstonia pseudosolanacearum TaxID=1310165 RepID=UPI003CF592A1